MAGRRKQGCLIGSAVLMVIVITIIGAIVGASYLRESLGDILRAQEEIEIPYQEIHVKQEEFAGKYYYELLSEEEKRVYQEIYQGLLDGVEEIYIHSDDANKINQLFMYVLNDYPEIFWCDGSGYTTTYRQGEETYSVLELEYQYQSEERMQKEQDIQNATEVIMGDAPIGGSDYEKIKYVYEYVINHTEYNDEAADNQNIYSVLVNGQSVCAGYARTTQYLLEKLGVFCTYVTGTATRPDTSESAAHAWNLVYCDGAYYYVDTTWGDPLTSEEEQNNIRYDYLCTNDAELFRTHTIEADIEFPECISLQYEYYVLNGMYYPEYNEDILLNAMKDCINEKRPEITFKFADEGLYMKARDPVLNELVNKAAEYLANIYGLSTVQYHYLDEQTLNKITIYWEYN